MLYDDENNVVVPDDSSSVVDDVVLCESGGVEVSTTPSSSKTQQRPPPLTTMDESSSPLSPKTITATSTAIPPFSPPSFSPKLLLKCWGHHHHPSDDSIKLANSSLPSPDSATFTNSKQPPIEDIVQWSGPPPFEETTGAPVVNKKEDHVSLVDESTVLSDEDCFDSDPFAPRAGKSLCWKNVNMVLRSNKTGSPKRKILDGVWGEVPVTETTAIMGASGCGKTSLLNVLSGRARSKGNLKVSSEVKFDDGKVDPTNIRIRREIAFVAQDDSLQATATPREAIRFSARLRLPRSTSDADIDKLVDRMIIELGLASCADTIVGGPLIKGISGGERKRTSVGVELVVKPSMVFLDEPTSGLDSYNALQVCQVLRKVAKAGASVLFTIHQPSSEIFNAFDHLILLHQGRVLYQGSVPEAQDYFENRGHPCPMNYNPADWFIAVAQNNTMEELEQSGFFPVGAEAKKTNTTMITSLGSSSDSLSTKSRRQDMPASKVTQMKLLFLREMMHMYRYPYPLYARYGLTIMLSALIGTIFYGIGKTDKSDPYNLQSHFGVVMCTLMMALLGTAQPSLLNFPEERPIFLREYSTDHYGVTTYFISRFFIEAAVTGVQVAIMVTIIFFLASFQGSYFVFLGATYALAMAGTAMAVTLGAACQGNTKLAQQMLPLIFIPQVVFSGFFIAPDMIPFVLRWVQHICVLTYATRLVVVSEFFDCSDQPLQAFTCNILLEKVNAHPDSNWYYWLMLIVFFVTFRTFALTLLSRSAKSYY